MNILIIGSGSKEHAIVKKIAQTNVASKIYVAPGNGGMKNYAELVKIDVLDNERLAYFAWKNKITLTIVGSDAALQNGIVDKFRAEQLMIIGPTATTFNIDKQQFVQKHNLNAVTSKLFSDFDESIIYAKNASYPIILKVAGVEKSAKIVNKFDEAYNVIYNTIVKKNTSIIIENYVDDIVFSHNAIINGKSIFPMDLCYSYNQIAKNCNLCTGMMGVYSPVSNVSPVVELQSYKILKKIAESLVEDGNNYCGFLRTKMALINNELKIVDICFNLVEGETEALLLRMENDFVNTLLKINARQKVELKWDSDFVVGVVLAVKDYPNSFETNLKIDELKEIDDNAFHISTKRVINYFTTGGRVALVYGKAATLAQARNMSYDYLSKIGRSEFFYRKDIALYD